MRGGIFLLLIGIIMAYLAVSGKYKCFTVFAKCVSGDGNCDCQSTTSQNISFNSGNSGSGGNIAINLPKLPPLPSSPIITNIYG